MQFRYSSFAQPLPWSCSGSAALLSAAGLGEIIPPHILVDAGGLITIPVKRGSLVEPNSQVRMALRMSFPPWRHLRPCVHTGTSNSIVALCWPCVGPAGAAWLSLIADSTPSLVLVQWLFKAGLSQPGALLYSGSASEP